TAATPSRPAPSLSPARRDGPVKASPVAKKLAQERGIDLAQVRGSGPGGRIVKEDVESAAAAGGQTPAAARPPGGPVKASPVAKRLAAEHNIDLALVAGTGPGGRIIKEDVEGALTAPPPAPAAAARLHGGQTTAAASQPLSGELPYRGIRRTIGQRMHESLQSMAQLTMSMDVDMTDAVKLRRDLVTAWEADGVRVSYTDMVVKAAALALRDHPRVNAALDGDTVRVQPQIDVGFAVALDEGLIVPVVRGADAKPLKAIAAESAALAARARQGNLTPDDLTGGTFTVTSLGMFDIDVFTPIINPPQAAILGVGRIGDRPAFVADSGTQIERRSYLTLSLTIDHRLIDGAPGAQYLQSLRRYLEHPYLLLTPV
ncbi:MAG: 2-oxo acid dehydrogenase subunit E2, partial [Dehalococcoidia bacterium]